MNRIALTCLLTITAALCPAASPDFDSEFFTDFSDSVPSRQKMEIRRTLRHGNEASAIHTMIVVIDYLSQFPDMPQDTKKFATKLAGDWGVGDQNTKRGILILLSLEERELFVAKTSNVDQALADNIRNAILGGRAKAALKANDIGLAMKLAAEATVDVLPTARAAAAAGGNQPTKQVTRTTTTRQYHNNRRRRGGGGGLGAIGGILVFVVVVCMIASLFGNRGGHGYGGSYGGRGGRGGWGGGGFMSGMLTGGMLGWMFSGNRGYGGHGGGGFTETTTTESWGGGGGGGGFDSFGGGNFDGGGSFGDW